MTIVDHAVYIYSKVWAAFLLIVCNILGLGDVSKHECMLCGSPGPDHYPDCQYIELIKYVRHG